MCRKVWKMAHLRKKSASQDYSACAFPLFLPTISCTALLDEPHTRVVPASGMSGFGFGCDRDAFPSYDCEKGLPRPRYRRSFEVQRDVGYGAVEKLVQLRLPGPVW